jgi:uncharacterized protein (TIGR04255 family)
MSNNKLPDYEKPPVAEVVTGIQFKPIKGLTGAYIGVLWEKFKPEYPRLQEVAPLAPVIEGFDETPAREMLSFGDFSPSRSWFETASGNGLIQVQRDRFLHNWKKEKAADEYPHYESVITNFRRHLETFEKFLEENGLEPIEPTQYEMTYVNHIFQGDGWQTLDEIGDVFQDFFRRKGDRRFLPMPEVFNWQTSFPLPERAGRLHVTIRLGKRRSDKAPALLLEITARGMRPDPSRSSMWSWFETAHEWIVYGFTDLTTPEIQTKVWRRKR